MKLLFKQRMFSWFDSYDIYDENRNTVYVIKGKLAWGHLFRIYDAKGNEIGTVRERIISLLPRFEIYLGDQYIGCIGKDLTLLKPKFHINFNGWYVKGNILEWDYKIYDDKSKLVAKVSKKLLHFTDHYMLDIEEPKDAVYVLMLVLAIDAEKCTREKKQKRKASD